MPGPLPKPDARRRNAPTIPTTNLPLSGRPGPAPKVPAWLSLGKHGRGWWAWAWKTPQACGWSTGDLALVARRASLEDDIDTLDHTIDSVELDELLDAKTARVVRDLIGRLAAMATGRLALMREMRELDDRLGLSPKGLAALRWKIVEDEEKPAAGRAAGTVRRSRYSHLAVAEAS